MANDNITSVIDFTGVGDFEPLPEGDYEATFEKFEMGLIEKGDNAGQPKVNLTYIVTEEGEYEGRKLWRTFSLVPKALWAFKKALIAMGADPEDFKGALTMDQLTSMLSSLVGARCVLSVVQREYEGRVRNDVKDVKDATAGALFR